MYIHAGNNEHTKPFEGAVNGYNENRSGTPTHRGSAEGRQTDQPPCHLLQPLGCRGQFRGAPPQPCVASRRRARRHSCAVEPKTGSKERLRKCSNTRGGEKPKERGRGTNKQLNDTHLDGTSDESVGSRKLLRATFPVWHGDGSVSPRPQNGRQ